MTESLAKTPLHALHRQLGARMVPYAGWEMPVQYQGVAAEHQAVRERAGLFDVCHMGELELRGPEAAAVVDGLITNDLGRARDGQALYTCCCDAQGGILDDLIIYRRSAERFLVVCNAANLAKIASHFSRAAEGRCSFEDLSPQTGLLALQGPRALEVLARAGCALEDVATALPSFHFADTRVAGLPVTVARTGYTGEDGVELFCAAADAPALWSALLAAGEPLGLAPAGLGARDTLRLEARLSLYGNDIDETTNPLEATLGWTVRLDKGDFIGRDALLAVKAAGLTRKLVGFEVTERAIARDHWDVLDASGAKVGYVTSGSPSPTTGKNIGLAYVPIALSEVGTEITVRDPERGRTAKAVVVKTPFYKRAK